MLVFILFVLVILLFGYFAFRYVEEVQPPRKVAGKQPLDFEFNEEIEPDIMDSKPELPEEKKTFNYAQWEDDPPIYLNIKESHIHLMMKDPDWLFTYWHWGQEAQDRFDQQFGEDAWAKSTPVIRYYEVNTDFFFDIPVNNYALTWYIKVNKRSVPITLSLGRILNHQFINFATTNTLVIPLDRLSPNIDPLWRPIKKLLPLELETTDKLETAGMSSLELTAKK